VKVWKSILAFSLFGLDPSFSFAVTNARYLNIPGIVYLKTELGQCTGTLVGFHPPTVLTAANCLVDLDPSNIWLAPDDEKIASHLNYDRPSPTQIIIDDSAHKSRTLAQRFELRSKTLLTLREERQIVRSLEDSMMQLRKKNEEASQMEFSDPRNTEDTLETKNLKNSIESDSKAAKEKLNELQDLEKRMEANFANGPKSEDFLDLAIVIFGKDHRFDGELEAVLLRDFKVFAISRHPVAPSLAVGLAGFGSKMPNSSKGLVPFAWNFIYGITADGVFIETLGVPPSSSPREGSESFGGLGNGDIGGPLFLKSKIALIGVNIAYEKAKSKDSRPPAPGWPQDPDGSYPVLIGTSLNLETPAASLFLKNASQQGADILYEKSP